MSNVVAWEGLTHLPVRLVPDGWKSTPEATRVPVRRVREWWSQDFALELGSGEVGSMVVALVLRIPEGGYFARLHQNHASSGVGLTVTVRSADWADDDNTQISFRMISDRFNAFVTTSVRDRALKADAPRATTAPASTVTATTGAVWTIAEFPSVDVVAEAVVLARRDTVASHGRWRLKAEHESSVPEPYGFLLGPPENGDLAVH